MLGLRWLDPMRPMVAGFILPDDTEIYVPFPHQPYLAVGPNDVKLGPMLSGPAWGVSALAFSRDGGLGDDSIR
jgi:hypothetical protein